MKVIIAGYRDITDHSLVQEAIRMSGFTFTEIVSGGARGVDYIGEALAELHGYPVKIFRADWKKYGKSAGPIRNREMALYADALVACWDGVSLGTKNMILEMKKLKKPVFIAKVVKGVEE